MGRKKESDGQQRKVEGNYELKPVEARPGAPHLVDMLKAILSRAKKPCPAVVLSPLGGIKGQGSKPFGKTLYGINETAKAVAELADETFTNFTQIEGQPSKTDFVMCALLSGMGTGKSSFLDRHATLLAKHCQNEVLRELLRPESHPLVLNVTLNSFSTYSAEEGADSGTVNIARRLVRTYTGAPWNSILAARTDGITSLRAVLEPIVDHHRKVCGMADDQPMVVVVNVDELNQIHAWLRKDKEAADGRVREIVYALRNLSMSGVKGVTGVGPAVLCLLASTGSVDFYRALGGSGIEYVTHGLPLLNGAEVMTLMEECGVHKDYLSDPSFLQLLEDTAGVPRVLRKLVEGLTLEYAESSIAVARSKALQYIRTSNPNLSEAEKAALLPYIVLGVPAPPYMSHPLDKQSPTSRTFEDLRLRGAIFQDGDQLVMPVLLLEALYPAGGSDVQTLVGRLIYWYRQRNWEGFEMFTALFHALKMQYLSAQAVEKVSMEDFYPGALMLPEVHDLVIRLEKSDKYEVKSTPFDTKTYRFPGSEEAKNGVRARQLMQGAILLNGKAAPAGDCVLANPLLDDLKKGVLVRSLYMAHTSDDTTLNVKKIGTDNETARETFAVYPELFAKMGATKVVTVHISNRELDKKVDVKKLPASCVVIARDEVPKFFGRTFHRGLLSPTHAASLRTADKPRAYCTASRAGGGQFARLSLVPRPVPSLPAWSVTGLRLVRNLARRLL